jgi:hypothetical protein
MSVLCTLREASGKDRVVSIRKIPGRRTGMSVYSTLYTLYTWREASGKDRNVCIQYSVYSLYLEGSLRKGQECLYTVLCILSIPGGKPEERTGLSLSGKNTWLRERKTQ